jgi:hypothetical protein
MFELFIEGGWQFMGLITIMALVMLFFSFKAAARIFGHSEAKAAPHSNSLYYIRFFGMLALVTGVLGQVVGLYEAMKQIAEEGGITQAVLAAGFRVSSITTLYGFIVFLLAHLIWFGLDYKARSAVKAQ